MNVTPEVVGEFIDSVAGQTDIPRRTVTTVAGRFIEEAVELGLAAGLSPTDIMAHVMDSIHNQCVKTAKNLPAGSYPVVYPSQYNTYAPLNLNTPERELAEEVADCTLVLRDLIFLSGIDLEWEVEVKWDAFTQRRFHVSEKGTLYAIK
jgi:hypothetical protein